MNKTFSFYTVALAAMLSFLLFVSFNSNPKEDASGAEPAKVSGETNENSLPQVIRSIDIHAQKHSFAGEEIPEGNFDATERLDRELAVNSYYHSSTILNIKRINRYFPVIERILEKNNIPDDFKYLAVAESGLQNVASPAGAKGYWQFMKSVGQQYGLEINGEVDERYHLEKSTQAACDLLNDNYRQLGNWTLVAAAYNMGVNGLKRLMGQQKAGTYYELNVNEETSRYVFRIMAIKEILSDPVKFGFQIPEDQLYEPLDDFTVVEVNGPVQSWGEFAIEHGTNYRILKVYNPWLTDSGLANSAGKTYMVRIPSA